MSDTQAATPAQDVLDKAVAEGGAYEVLHKRLLEQGQRLRQTAEGSTPVAWRSSATARWM